MDKTQGPLIFCCEADGWVRRVNKGATEEGIQYVVDQGVRDRIYFFADLTTEDF